MAKPNGPVFKCHVCGVDTVLAAEDPTKTVCPDHCEDHDYEYRSEAEWAHCVHCDEAAPSDYYDEQPGDYD